MSASSTEIKTPSVAETDIVCVCGSRDLVDLGPCRNPGVGRCSEFEKTLSQQIDPGRLYRCRECHLGLRLPRPDDATIASLYEGLSVTRWKKGTVAGSAQQYLVKRFSSRSGKTRCMDIGAFDGTFLQALPDSFEKAAIEPSHAAAELEQLGIKVLKPFLEPATEDESGSYDVVTMFDVFEHLANPLEGMKSAMSYVRPGGSLFIGTSNLDHWSWRQTLGMHWYLDPIQHVVVGSVKHFQWQMPHIGASAFRSRIFNHQPGSVRQRLFQSLVTFYFGAKDRGGWRRIVRGLMNRSSTFSRMSHKHAIPYTQQLHDHILAEFVRSEVVA